MPRTSWLVLLAALALTPALAGCIASGTVPPRDARGRYVIHATGQNTFVPANARIPRGGTVVWVVDASAHDVSADDGSFSSAERGLGPDGYPLLLHPGDEYAHTFNQTGSWLYWCHTHHEFGMKGTIHVK